GWLLGARRWLRGTRRAARDYERLMRQLPGDVADVMHRLRTGAFEIKHEHHRLEGSVNRLVLGLLTASLLLRSALLLRGGESASPGVLRLVLGLACLGLGAFLGFRVFTSIKSSDGNGRHG